MAEWSTTTKHEPSSINGGRKYEDRDRLSIEQLNNMTENAFYAMAKSDEAKAESASAKQVADEALAQAQTTGTRVLVNGSFVTEFDSNTKADKLTVDEIQEEVDNLEITKAEVDASNLTEENTESWKEKLDINKKQDYYDWQNFSEITDLSSGSSFVSNDISGLIENYDLNGVYEVMMRIAGNGSGSSNGSFIIKTDIITNNIGAIFLDSSNLSPFRTVVFNVPVKKYIYCQMPTNFTGSFRIIAYRRIK